MKNNVVVIIISILIGIVVGWGGKTIKVESAIKDGYVTKAEYNRVLVINQKLKKAFLEQGKYIQNSKKRQEIPINVNPNKTPTIMTWKSNLKR